MSIPWTREDMIADLYRRIAELERRGANRKRTGLVTDVDEKKGLFRVDLGQDPVSGEPFKSPWLPAQELAMGGVKSSFMPTVGEQVDVVSETGDISDGYISMSLPTDKNPRPHDKAGEGKLKAGSSTFLIKDGNVEIRANRIDLNPPE